MAFLLERPRSFDVDAAADGTRILSLSEGALRTMIAEDATSPPNCCSISRRCSACASSGRVEGGKLEVGAVELVVVVVLGLAVDQFAQAGR